jgi:predicted enzyme related to lactoylglutathione lyase
MPSLPKSGAVLFAKDLPRLASFYESVAGLSITISESDVIVLESSTMQLVLHGIPARIARTITIASPPTLRSDTAVKLVFAVASLAQARADAVRFGGALNATKKEFEARGIRACDGHDPEGNVIQFREALS